MLPECVGNIPTFKLHHSVGNIFLHNDEGEHFLAGNMFPNV